MAHKFNVIQPVRQGKTELVHGRPCDHAIHHGRPIGQGLANGLQVKDLNAQPRRLLTGRQAHLPVGLPKTVRKLGLRHTHGDRGRMHLPQICHHRLCQINAFVHGHHHIPSLRLGPCHLGRIQHQGPFQGPLPQLKTQAHQHAPDHGLCKCHGHGPGSLACGCIGQVVIFHLGTLHSRHHQTSRHLHIEMGQGSVAYIQFQLGFHDPVVLLERGDHARTHVKTWDNVVHGQTQPILRACVAIEEGLTLRDGARLGLDARKHRTVNLCQTARFLDYQLQRTARAHGQMAAGTQSPHRRNGWHIDLRRQGVCPCFRSNMQTISPLLGSAQFNSQLSLYQGPGPDEVTLHSRDTQAFWHGEEQGFQTPLSHLIVKYRIQKQKT